MPLLLYNHSLLHNHMDKIASLRCLCLLCFAAFYIAQTADATRAAMHQFTNPNTKIHSLTKFDTFMPLDSSSPPFSLPPYQEALPPFPLSDQNTPPFPFCIFPPSTPLQPPSTSPTPPPASTITPIPPTPILPESSPPPPDVVPYPPSYVPSPTEPVFSPPYYEPSPPSYAPGPPQPIIIPPPSGYTPTPRFLPPIVYPPPAVPPPPHRIPVTAMWCVAKASVPDPIIQEAMNYACFSGAECSEIQPGGSCFQPDTLFAHASYAFNSYYQRSKAAGGSCDFGGTAILVTVDPSYDGCHFVYF